jgi:hypothetical protein
MYGPVEYIYKDGRIGARRIQCQLPTGMIKKVIQQGRASLVASRRGQPLFDARSVLLVREHGKMARTPPCLSHPERWAICFQHSHLLSVPIQLFSQPKRNIFRFLPMLEKTYLVTLPGSPSTTPKYRNQAELMGFFSFRYLPGRV